MSLTKPSTLSDKEILLSLPPKVSMVTMSGYELRARTMALRIVRSSATSESPGNHWLDRVFAALADLSALPDRWDGALAHRPTGDALHAAVSFLSSIPVGVPQPDVSPDVDGGVGVEWIRADLDLTVTFGPDGDASLFFSDGLSTWEGPFGSEPDGFDKMLWRITTAA